jgi:hypothetical protein
MEEFLANISKTQELKKKQQSNPEAARVNPQPNLPSKLT